MNDVPNSLQTFMQMLKKLIPDSKSVTVVYGSDEAMKTAGLAALEKTKHAGLCVTAFIEADFLRPNYTATIDEVLEQSAKGNDLFIDKKSKET